MIYTKDGYTVEIMPSEFGYIVVVTSPDDDVRCVDGGFVMQVAMAEASRTIEAMKREAQAIGES